MPFHNKNHFLSAICLIYFLAFNALTIEYSFAGGCTTAPNNDCVNAITLVVNDVCVNGNTCGNIELGESTTCSPIANQTVWYSFVATDVSMAVVVENLFTGGCNIGSSVWDGSGGCLPSGLLSCQNIAGAPIVHTHSLTGLTVSNTYYVRVEYNRGGLCGQEQTFCIKVSDNIDCAGNDVCGSACPVALDNTCYSSTLEGASDNLPGIGGCQSANGHPEVWFVGKTDGDTLTFTVDNLGAGFTGDIELTVFSGSCGGLIIEGSSCGPAPLNFILAVTPGMKYWWTVSSSDGANGPGSTFNICVNNTGCPTYKADAGQDAIICALSSYTTLGADTGGGVSSIIWTTSGTGTFSDSSVLITTYSPSLADETFGSVTLTITTNDPDGPGPCLAASDSMVLMINQTITVFPYIQNFDAFTPGTPGMLLDDWRNVTGDDFDWYVNTGGTSSLNTGPPSDHTTGSGNYMYTESTWPNYPNKIAILVTPCIDISGLTNPFLEFWYHMYGAAMGALNIDIQVIGGPLFLGVDAISGNQDNKWHMREIDLSAYSGVIQIIFRGETGSSFTSDMAIDDVKIYDKLPNDVGVIAIRAPNTGCSLSASESVTIRVRNFGTEPQDTIPVSYTVNGGTPVNDTIFTLLNPGNRVSFTFTFTADLSATGTYIFDAWTALGTDANNINDSLTNYKVNHLVPVIAFPYIENFDAFTPGTPGILLNDWLNAAKGDFDWYVNNGTTPTISTGPSADHTTGTGNYMYTEADGNIPAKIAFLTSPCIDISSLSNPFLEFWYHMYGSWMGTLYIDIESGGVWTQGVDSIVGDQGDNWFERQVDLSAFSGIIRVGFRGVTGAWVFSDMAIDDVKIYDKPPNDVGVIFIGDPNSGCGLSANEPVTVRVENFGLISQDTIPVSYSVNGGIPVNDTIFVLLNPGNTTIFIFATPVDLSTPGTYIFDAWTSLTGDGDNSNDSTTGYQVLHIAINTFPYIEDFEDSTLGEFLNSGEINTLTWVNTGIHGSDPGHSATRSAYFGNPADTSYNTGFVEGANLTLPCIDLSSLDSVQLSFNYFLETENLDPWDDARVSISTDNITYIAIAGNNIIGNLIDPSLTWQALTLDISAYGGFPTVYLRFSFNTGDTFWNNFEGFYIDDINISVIDSCVNDVGVIAIDAPVTGCGLSASESITIRVVNFCTTQDTIPVNYSVDGGPVIVDTIFTLLNPGDTVSFTFTTTADLSALGPHLIESWTNLPGDTVISNDFEVIDVENFLQAAEPTAVNGQSCGPDSVILSVTGSAPFHFWYDSIIDGNLLERGDTFVTPYLFTNTTYYAEGRNIFNDSIETTFAGGPLVAPGNMFDVTAKNPLTITSFDVHFSTLNADIEIYYKQGSYIGFENTPGDWTFIGNSNISGNGFGNPTPVPIPIDIFIADGETYAFYITRTDGGNLLKSFGTIEGEVFVEDFNIQVREGTSNSYPFGGTFSPRIWNGIVHYLAAVCPSARIAVTATIDSFPVVDLGTDTSFCNTITLDAQNPGAGYVWSTGDITQIITVSTSNTYWVEVMYSNGCTANDTIEITVNSISISITDSTNVMCNGDSTGSATVTPTGGTPPYTYLWNDPNAQTDSTATGLPAGTYKVIVTNINGCTDSVNVTILPPLSPLSGTYTIGGVTPDYADFTSAVADLNSRGVLAAVTFDVRDGTYTEQITIDSICGASTFNTVTFQSENSDSTLVILTFAANSIDNYTVRLNNSDFITFRQMTIAATNTTNGRVFVIAGGSSNNKLLNNRITGVLTSFITNNVALIFSSGGADENNEFRNNVLVDGSHGFYYIVSASESGTVISGNTFTNQYRYGMYLSGLDAPEISSNIISTNSSFNFLGISCNYCDNALIISKNKVTTTTTNGYGILLVNCDGAPGNEGMVSNNFVQIGTNNETYGFYINSSFYQNIYHNSIHITSTDIVDGRALFTTSSGGNLNIVNNIFMNSGGGYTVYINTPAAIATMDYNDLYTTGTYIGNWGGSDYTTLTQWQDSTLQDSNSISVDPLFNSITDLHANSPILDDAGTDLSSVVTDDIDGETRPAAPCIGADEFNIGCALSVNITDSANVLCNGDSTGSATVTPTGGTQPYTYLWNTSPAQTDSTATGLPAGTYQIIVNDINGCVDTATVSITEPLPIPFTLVSETICYNDSIFLQNAWQDTAGTYYDTSLSVNGCDSVIITTLTIDIIPTVNIGIDNTYCDSIELDAGGGGVDSYLWNTGDTTRYLTVFVSGTYFVTITKDNCEASDTITITLSVLSVSITDSANVFCNGDSTGFATVTPTGGTQPYTYLWNTTPAQTDSTATGLPAGTYEVLVTDTNGCSDTATVTITEPPTALTSSISSDSVSCAGACDATATVNTSGGTPPYTYQWSNGDTMAIADSLCAGPLSITITDANGCFESHTISIFSPPPISTVTASSDVTCNGACDGAATVTASNGIPPYTYQWNDPLFQTTPTADSLCAGTFEVLVTDSNGCTAIDSIIIIEPTSMGLLFLPNQPTCNGGCDGSVSVTPSGGTPPYSYLWMDNAFNPLTPPQTDSTATGLCAGLYNVAITDSNGCVNTTGVIITDPTPLTASITGNDAACGGVCDGDATMFTSGGALPYTYLWNDPDSQTTPTATGLCADTFVIIVTDANGCSVSDTVTISEPPVLGTSITSATNPSCFGFCDGVANAVASGGTQPYTYLWSNGDNTPIADSLCAGPYSITITDSNSCTATEFDTLIDPSPINISISGKDSICSGICDGDATAIASGGTAPYSFIWSNSVSGPTITALCPNTYIVTVTDNNSCTGTDTIDIIVLLIPSVSISGNTTICQGSSATFALNFTGVEPFDVVYTDNVNNDTVTVNNLTIGDSITFSPTVNTTYTLLSITDSMGCPGNAGGNVVITVISVPPAPTAGTDAIYCYGEPVADLTATGINIEWFSDAGLTNLIGTGSPFAIAPDVDITIYYVTQTVSGCQSPASSVTITIYDQSSIDAGKDTVICMGESTHLQATGGTDYQWSPDEGLSDSEIAEPIATPSQTTTYYVQVSINDNCVFEDSVIITVRNLKDCWEIYNTFSPNGDGKNDTWIIDGIQLYEINSVTIFNRWKDVVNEFVNYDNKTEVWDGTNKNGADLPDGTYFYIIDTGDEQFTGWVQIAR